MPRKIQEPVARVRDDPVGGTEYSHPAFAQISAGRISGRAVLYGSDFVHQHSIRIRISRSAVTRSLSSDWLSAASLPYIEVEMSEAQWASFVSSLNVGQGTSCTVRYLNGDETPGLPDPTPRTEVFAKEASDRMRDALESLRELGEAIGASGLSGKKAAPLLSIVNRAVAQIDSNQDFVAKQFEEHMEGVTEAAKVEVNAYAINTLMRAGIASLAGGNPVIELIESKKEKDEC